MAAKTAGRPTSKGAPVRPVSGVKAYGGKPVIDPNPPRTGAPPRRTKPKSGVKMTARRKLIAALRAKQTKRRGVRLSVPAGQTVRVQAHGGGGGQAGRLDTIELAALTAKKRNALKKSSFAVPQGKGSQPQKDSYPVNDLAHAKNALARVAQHGTPQEKRLVIAAVRRKFPALAKRSAAIKKAS